MGYRTLCHKEQLIVEAVPVHRRARDAGWNHQEYRANAIVSVGAILEDVAGDGAKCEDLGVVLPVQLHRGRAAVWRHIGSVLCQDGRKQARGDVSILENSKSL